MKEKQSIGNQRTMVGKCI